MFDMYSQAQAKLLTNVNNKLVVNIIVNKQSTMYNTHLYGQYVFNYINSYSYTIFYTHYFIFKGVWVEC